MSQNDYAQTVVTAEMRTRVAVTALMDELVRNAQGGILPEALTGTQVSAGLASAAVLLDCLRIDLGYAVAALPQTDGSVLLWAERGNEILAAKSHSDGYLELDQAGVLDGSCQGNVEKLRAATASRGLMLGLGRALPHGDPRGGSLIRTAGRPAPTPTMVAAAAPVHQVLSGLAGGPR